MGYFLVLHYYGYNCAKSVPLLYQPIYIYLSTWEDRTDMILDLYQTQRWIQYSTLQDGDAGLQNHTAQNLISKLGAQCNQLIK